MKNLDKLTGKKATDVANALLDEGYPDNRVIPTAINQTKRRYEDASELEKRILEKEKNLSKTGEHDMNPRAGRLPDSDVIVEYEEEQRIVKSKGAEKASNHFDTKKRQSKEESKQYKTKNQLCSFIKKMGQRKKKSIIEYMQRGCDESRVITPLHSKQWCFSANSEL